MGPTDLRGIRVMRDTLSNVESHVFTPYKFGSTAGNRTPYLWTTRPTCYNSATTLCYVKCKRTYIIQIPGLDPDTYYQLTGNGISGQVVKHVGLLV